MKKGQEEDTRRFLVTKRNLLAEWLHQRLRCHAIVVCMNVLTQAKQMLLLLKQTQVRSAVHSCKNEKRKETTLLCILPKFH